MGHGTVLNETLPYQRRQRSPLRKCLFDLRSMTRKGQAPAEACEQPLSFLVQGQRAPSPGGLGCASDGVLADRPVLLRQLSVRKLIFIRDCGLKKINPNRRFEFFGVIGAKTFGLTRSWWISFLHSSLLCICWSTRPAPCLLEHCAMVSLLLCVHSRWDGRSPRQPKLHSDWLAFRHRRSQLD